MVIKGLTCTTYQFIRLDKQKATINGISSPTLEASPKLSVIEKAELGYQEHTGFKYFFEIAHLRNDGRTKQATTD